MLDKSFIPQDHESKLYEAWEASGIFEPTMDTAEKPYAIMMPPPNVTGVLHLGHALDSTLTDMKLRRAKMQGYDAFYQPGTDHAGIATQMVVERNLAKEGIKRKDLGRDKFLEKVWEWKEHSGGTITRQFRTLGVSAAWQRERFTMDDVSSKAVQTVFIELYKKGIIHKGKRLVNWDTVLQTAVSDVEVEHKDVNGHFYHLNYKVVGEDRFLTVATTRPETLLGDTALAVNSKDERYKDLVGKEVELPLTGRTIPVIADRHADMEKGSGVVKITPAHDFNDFEVGKRNNLPMINVMNPDGTMNDECPEKYRGMDRFDCRKQIIKDLEELGQVVKIEDHPHSVGHGDRGGQPIEPYLTDQWYVKSSELIGPVKDAIESGEVSVTPERQKKIALNWINNIEDWCISRQLWWGHQIPAWYKGDEIYVGETAPEGEGWVQDQDVLDTWFSSALWPMSTLGFPEQTPEMEKFYPTESIMPGVDIIFFWVIRMMMMCMEFTGKSPFKEIYLHALVLDENGKKMSKSKGNAVDPLDIAKEYGSDALRFALASHAAPGQDIRFSEQKVENARNFINKIWNASKFAEMNGATYSEDFDPKTVKHPVNKWMMNQLHSAIADIDKAFDDYRYNDVSTRLYNLIWNQYCDWYVELTKPMVYAGKDEAVKAETQATMGYVLEQVYKLTHTVMPYVSEVLWTNLTGSEEGMILEKSWPTTADVPYSQDAEDQINWLINLISTLRNVRAENNVPAKAEVEALVSSERLDAYTEVLPFTTLLAKVTSFAVADRAAQKTDVVAIVAGEDIILPLEGVVDFEAERARISKEIEKHEAELNKVNGMLNNDNFISRAPDSVVAEQKARQEELLGDLAKLKETYEARA